MELEIERILRRNFTRGDVQKAKKELLLLMGENKNPITGEGADNKSTDNG